VCRSVRCRTCGKTTWAGCGLHIDQVRAGVPAENWCRGHDKEQPATRSDRPGGWLARLRSRR